MYRIKEYAMPLDKIGVDLRANADRLVEHLLKVFYYRNTTGDLNHWVSEIYAFIHIVPRTKKTNKAPKRDYIKKNLWGYKEDIFHIVHKKLIKSFSIRYGFIELDPRAKVFCEEYIDWLSGELSRGYSVTIEEISDCIRALIKRYPV